VLTDQEARARLLKILDDAKTFEDLGKGITAEYAEKESHPVFGCALRFLAEADPTKLDAGLQERLAQVLSRFVESKEALHLAGVLEGQR
jgi:hypothetical protein